MKKIGMMLAKISFAVVGISSVANAGVALVPGEQAIKTILDSDFNGEFDGADTRDGSTPCAVLFNDNGKVLVVRFQENGKTLQTLVFARSRSYHVGIGGKTDDNLLIVAGPSHMIRIETASDMFSRVTTRVKGQSLTCEADF